jgi:hypothetical protein
MYYLIIFRDIEQQHVIFVSLFSKLKNIFEYTDHLITYANKNKKYKFDSNKKLFKIVKIKL